MLFALHNQTFQRERQVQENSVFKKIIQIFSFYFGNVENLLSVQYTANQYLYLTEKIKTYQESRNTKKQMIICRENRTDSEDILAILAG